MDSKLASDSVDKSISLFTERDAEYKVQEPDSRRMKTCLQITKGNSLLDIGTHHGILVNAALISNQFDIIEGVDLKRSPNAIIDERIEYRYCSITDTDFVNRQFDTVVCMEVIEHVESQHNSIMLENLRNSTSKRLIVTVPFNEPEPVWWHDKPGGHRQKFTLEQLGRMFPKGIATIEPRWGVEWIFIVEDETLKNEYFQLVTKAKFMDLLSN